MAYRIFLALSAACFSMVRGQSDPMTTDAPDAPCAPVAVMEDVCESLTPDFSDLQLADQATCLCYGWVNSRAWEPSIYDQAFASCFNYLSTADPEDYSTLGEAYGTITAPCAAVGNVAEARTTDSYGLPEFYSVLATAATASPGGTSSGALTPTGRASGVSRSSSALFFSTPAPGTNGAGGGVILTPGSSTRSAARTGAGGNVLQSSSARPVLGGGAMSSANAAGSKPKPSLAASHVKANAGFLAGVAIAVAVL